MTRESTGTSTALHSDNSLRFDWTKSEVQSIYRTALPDLLFRAQTIHRQFHPPDGINAVFATPCLSEMACNRYQW